MTDQHITEEELNDQLLVRREKMQAMAEANINPFDIGFERSHLSQDVIKEFNHLDKQELEEQ